MARRAPHMRTAPFRFLTLIYWASIPGITILSPGVVQIETGLSCRRLQISYRELWKYLHWLEEQQYLEIIEKLYGVAIVKIVVPISLREDVR